MPRSARRARSVLITNGWFRGYSGTEIVTRDFALGLARRGWRAAIYAPTLGSPMADEVQGEVALLSDLAGLERAPDIIHGHHHPALAPALVRLRDTPAIQVCHDAVTWYDGPLALERVRLHVAVDEVCRARVAREACVPAEAVRVLPNAIDLDRCPARPPLPARPGRALIVAHHADTHVAACLSACERAGLEATTAGFAVGRATTNLPAMMADADVVIGAARIALEGMAVGCAVVVADDRGLAGMARAADFDAWRAANFGRALLTGPVTPESVGAALAAYNVADAAALQARVRAACGLETALDRLEAIYADAVDAHRATTADSAREAADLAAYLQRQLVMDAANSPWGPDIERLGRQAAIANTRLERLVQELTRRGMNVTFSGAGAEQPPPAR